MTTISNETGVTLHAITEESPDKKELKIHLYLEKPDKIRRSKGVNVSVFSVDPDQHLQIEVPNGFSVRIKVQFKGFLRVFASKDGSRLVEVYIKNGKGRSHE